MSVSKNLYQVDGFKDLERKIKTLKTDGEKRKPIISILKKVSTPTLKAAISFAPVGTIPHKRYQSKTGKVLASYKPGNLKRSLGKILAKRNKPNVRVDIGARVSKFKLREDDGYYAHMIVNKGFKGISRKSGTNNFLARAFATTKGQVTADAEKQVARHMQKIINRLSV